MEDMLPYFESHGAAIQTVHSNNGREYCGRPDHHPYELFLQLEGIEHRTTKVRRPQSNGFIERLHETLLDEFFRIAGRTKWYESDEEMQKDLDPPYSLQYEADSPGPHDGGRTPLTMFKRGIPRSKLAAADALKQAA